MKPIVIILRQDAETCRKQLCDMMTLDELIKEAENNSGIASYKFKNHMFVKEIAIDLGERKVYRALNIWIKTSVPLEDIKDETINLITTYDMIQSRMRGVFHDAYNGEYIYFLHRYRKTDFELFWNKLDTYWALEPLIINKYIAGVFNEVISDARKEEIILTKEQKEQIEDMCDVIKGIIAKS